MPYLAFFSLPISLVWILSRISSLSKESLSLYLILLSIIYMYAGLLVEANKKRPGQSHHPAFIIGLLGLILAPWYMLSNVSLLAIVQVIYSLHFYQVKVVDKALFPNREKQTGTIFLLLSHISAFIYILLFGWQGFPISLFYFGINLVYSFIYLKIACQQDIDNKGITSISAYLLGLFVNITFFEGLLIHAPIYEITWYLILTIPLIWLLFWLGYWGKQQGWLSFSQAIYEIQFVTIIISFLIPLQLRIYSLDFICILSFGYLFSLLFFSLITEDVKVLYPIILILAFLYYYLIPKEEIGPGGINLLFLVPGFVLLSLGLWFQKKKRTSLAEMGYLGWIVMTIFFLATLNYDSPLSLYGLSVYALLYGLACTYTYTGFPTLSRVFYWAMNAISLATLVLWVPGKNVLVGIFLAVILGISYFFIAYRTKKNLHLYIACGSLAFAHYLVFLINKPWETILFYVFPIAFIFYSVAMWSSHVFPKAQKVFKSVGHFEVGIFTILALMNFKSLTPSWLFISLVIYTLGYLSLTCFSPCYEYLFLTGTFFALSFYFSLIKYGLTPLTRLEYFFLCPVIMVLIAYIIKRKGKVIDYQPILDVAMLAALSISFITLFYGNKELLQKTLLFSTILYLLIAIQLKRELYVYLSTLTLGLLGYNFSHFAHQHFRQDLLVYTIYLIVFLSLFCLSSSLWSIPEEEDASGQKNISTWKKFFAYSLLLTSFPCLMIPLYTQKITTYPGFCHRCHESSDNHPAEKTWLVESQKYQVKDKITKSNGQSCIQPNCHARKDCRRGSW